MFVQLPKQEQAMVFNQLSQAPPKFVDDNMDQIANGIWDGLKSQNKKQG